METDEYCVEKVSFYQLNLLRLDVAMTLIYTQYLAPFLSPPSSPLGFVALRQCDVALNVDVFNVQQGLSNILESLEKNLKNALWFIFVQQVMHNNKNVLNISDKR